jgi:hypothetical protein
MEHPLVGGQVEYGRCEDPPTGGDESREAGEHGASSSGRTGGLRGNVFTGKNSLELKNRYVKSQG